MYKAWRIFWYEFRTNFRRRSYLLTTFGIPLLLVALVYLLTGIAGDTFNAGGGATGIFEGITGEGSPAADVLGFVDHSGLFTTPAPGSRYADRIRFYDSEADAQAALEGDAIRAYYVVSTDYLANGEVARFAKQFDVINALTDMGTAQDFLTSQLAGDTDPNVLLRVIDPVNYERKIVPISADEASPGEEGATRQLGEAVAFLMPYIMAILIMMGTFFASGYLMVSISQEKESRTIEILLSSARPFPLLVGKVLASGALGLLQIAFTMIVLWQLAPRAATQIAALAGLEVPFYLVVVGLVYFLGGYLLIGGLYAGVAAVAPKMQDAQQFVGFMVLPFVLPMIFLTEFMTSPNGGLAVFLSMFPITAPLGMTMRLSLTSVPLIEIIVSLVLLAITAVASIWFAARLFRVNTLLAGQAPRVRDLVRLVREG